jgi:hypothetical protein
MDKSPGGGVIEKVVLGEEKSAAKTVPEIKHKDTVAKSKEKLRRVCFMLFSPF